MINLNQVKKLNPKRDEGRRNSETFPVILKYTGNRFGERKHSLGRTKERTWCTLGMLN